jgi:hypothetical protein
MLSTIIFFFLLVISFVFLCAGLLKTENEGESTTIEGITKIAANAQVAQAWMMASAIILALAVVLFKL